MPTGLARTFRAQLNALHATLLEVPPVLADAPWRPNGWTRKQIVGHLLDSAANNRQRFVRAAIEGQYSGPQYAQDDWVAAHGYADQSWDDLLRWWLAEHEILIEVVDRIPEDRLSAPCRVGDGDPVTLRFLIEDLRRPSTAPLQADHGRYVDQTQKSPASSRAFLLALVARLASLTSSCSSCHSSFWMPFSREPFSRPSWHPSSWPPSSPGLSWLLSWLGPSSQPSLPEPSWPLSSLELFSPPFSLELSWPLS